MFDMYKTENISAGPAIVLVIQSLVALLGLEQHLRQGELQSAPPQALNTVIWATSWENLF